MADAVLVWFRQDLRLADNPALDAAVKSGKKIIPLYILDDINSRAWKMGGASRAWLHHSLESLHKSLSGNLVVRAGDAAKILPALIKETGASAIYWNRCYEPWCVTRDKKLKESLGIEVKSFNASLLFEPWEVLKGDGTPYRVFTPFFRKGCLARPEPSQPRPAPKSISFAGYRNTGTIADLDLLPRLPWAKNMMSHWHAGEKGASTRLKDFLEDGLRGYKELRNRPDKPNTSRLSPHLHFGEISPRAVWHAMRARMAADGLETDGDCLLSELGWREFSYSLLHYNNDMPEAPLTKKFADFPWRKNEEALKAWQRGQTGFPIVDAGMRELWATGYMHNRVRMIVASFLVKDLLIPWQRGAEWFWDTLVDADLANNSASWQWVAGCGADAAPYFRIFNPTGQGEKFDPNGDYVRRWVPELAKLPSDYIHNPAEAPDDVLQKAGIRLGKDYPFPIVDHKKARDEALKAFKELSA